MAGEHIVSRRTKTSCFCQSTPLYIHGLWGQGSCVLPVAVCCSVMQCFAVCEIISSIDAFVHAWTLRARFVCVTWCSVLQRVAACCSVLQCVSYFRLLPPSTYIDWKVCVCCLLQCVALCCSVLQRVAACCSMWVFFVNHHRCTYTDTFVHTWTLRERFVCVAC